MKKPGILVVDDSTVMRQLTSAILEQAGYRVLLAEDGLAALARVLQEPVQLVLTDWNMSPMDGRELTRQLRALAHFRQVPILVLSTEIDEASKDAARQAGASGWLGKPIEPATLVAVIGSLLALP